LETARSLLHMLVQWGSVKKNCQDNMAVNENICDLWVCVCVQRSTSVKSTLTFVVMASVSTLRAALDVTASPALSTTLSHRLVMVCTLSAEVTFISYFRVYLTLV
jgi:hypothetical protein